jgi:hypothetical protein
MFLRVEARRLVHQFVRLRAYFRKKLDLLRRSTKAIESRSPAETHRIAIHEAGHAVLQIALDLDCKMVSIYPVLSRGWEGFSLSGGLQPQVSGEKDAAIAERHMVARGTFYLRQAMVAYAGAEAVRQLIPTDPNPEAGASVDKRLAAEHILHDIEGCAESIDLLFSLAKRRCALLVTHHQPEIQALAGALKAKLILSGRAARKVFMRSLSQRSGRLMIFKTDPILHKLAGDEAFRAFLRRINLPD